MPFASAVGARDRPRRHAADVALDLLERTRASARAGRCSTRYWRVSALYDTRYVIDVCATFSSSQYQRPRVSSNSSMKYSGMPFCSASSSVGVEREVELGVEQHLAFLDAQLGELDGNRVGARRRRRPGEHGRASATAQSARSPGRRRRATAENAKGEYGRHAGENREDGSGGVAARPGALRRRQALRSSA